MYIGSNTPLRQLQEYYNRIRIGGGTTPTDGANLLAFVEGINDLGLWANMVCWPLRSSQNASNTTTAFSLGGLGNFNGTLINMTSAAWSNQGLVSTATNQQINVAYNSVFLGIQSSYAAFFCSSSAQNNVHFTLQDGTGTGVYMNFKFDGNASFGTSGVAGSTTRASGNNVNQSLSRLINLTSFQSSAYVTDVTSDTTYQDGAVAVSGARTGLPTRNPTGTPFLTLNAGSSAKTCSIILAQAGVLSSSQVALINAIYKSTIGQGLGLP